jgi:hypothetical protein
MRSMQTERLELDDISAIRAEISRAIPDGETSVLTLAFRGVYRDGSAGNPDARYMAAIATQAVYAWEPRAVVYDLRTLEYRWGDGILQLFESMRKNRCFRCLAPWWSATAAAQRSSFSNIAGAVLRAYPAQITHCRYLAH